MGCETSANLLTDWICRISRLSALFVGREMSRLGFGPAQFFILSELYVEDGISQDALSRRVMTDKSNTSRALTKLEQYGLIRRQVDPTNHRVKRVFLEPKAVEIENVFSNIREQWNSELLSNFSKMEIQVLLSGIQKIAANAEATFYAQQSQKIIAMDSKRTRKQCEEIYPMTLTDILSKEAWAQFEKDLYDRWQISATVYDTSGVSVTGKPNWCNKLCPQIKANKDSLAAICAPGNQNFMAMARQTKKPVIGECDAGLIKIAVPIFINGDFMGTAGGCGLLPEGGEVEEFLIEKSMGIDEEKITALCDGLGSMTEAQAKEMATFIENRIDQYVADATGKSN